MWLVSFFRDARLSENRLNNDLLERTLVNLCQNQRHTGDVISQIHLNILLIVKNLNIDHIHLLKLHISDIAI